MMIELSRNFFETSLCLLADKLFSLPEIVCIRIKKLEICRNNKKETIKLAIDECYHDSYSDIDLYVVVNLSADGGISPDEYVKHIGHWGFPPEEILGICFFPENHMHRIVLKNGMRYDLGFEFVFRNDTPIISLKPAEKRNNNANWPIENIDRFWFVQIQALGKLYRNDFLISGHLANVNINETLVQQMVLRDLKYNTNHHRYGYKEEFIYSWYTALCPYRSGNTTFDYIADRIYSAALACDELNAFFYDDYRPRSKDFFDIWKYYEEQSQLASKEHL